MVLTWRKDQFDLSDVIVYYKAVLMWRFVVEDMEIDRIIEMMVNDDVIDRTFYRIDKDTVLGGYMSFDRVVTCEK